MSGEYSAEEYTAYMEERKTLIEAARESAKTFDQAVLAFGSAIFGASVAFLKDVAPHPAYLTLKWLGMAWLFFSCGLLAALLSFILSHKACMFEIDAGSECLGKPDAKRPCNRSSISTDWCNYVCIGLLFLGMVSWAIFALKNLNQGANIVSQQPPQPYEKVERGYVPPKAPPPPPRSPSTTNSTSIPAKK